MKAPNFLTETCARLKAEPLWGVAFVATLLLPWMLVFARAGIEVCCGIIGLSFLWVSFRRRDWRWLKQPFAIICLIAWAWLTLVVTPLAVKPEAGMVEALMWFRLPLMVIALRYYVLERESAHTTLGLMLGLLLGLIIVDSVWQYLTGISFTGNERLDSKRLTGPFVGPKVGLYLGKMLLPVVAYGFAHALHQHSKRGSVAVIALVFGVLMTILLSGERSALLCTLLGLSVAAGMMMIAEKRWRLPCLLVALMGVGVLAYLYSTNDWIALRADQALETMGNYWQSDYGLLANAAIEIGMKHLPHGVGLSNFRDFCPELPYHGFFFKGIHPHNAYAEWFVETGLPGLLIFVAMILILLRDSLQQFLRARGLERLVPALAVGVVAQHFFPLMGMQSFFTNWPAMMAWYPLGLAFAGLPKEQRT